MTPTHDIFIPILVCFDNRVSTQHTSNCRCWRFSRWCTSMYKSLQFNPETMMSCFCCQRTNWSVTRLPMVHAYCPAFNFASDLLPHEVSFCNGGLEFAFSAQVASHNLEILVDRNFPLFVHEHSVVSWEDVTSTILDRETRKIHQPTANKEIVWMGVDVRQWEGNAKKLGYTVPCFDAFEAVVGMLIEFRRMLVSLAISTDNRGSILHHDGGGENNRRSTTVVDFSKNPRLTPSQEGSRKNYLTFQGRGRERQPQLQTDASRNICG
jgi:hypothetical protein